MANNDFDQYLNGRRQDFNPYGAGRKDYGPGRSAPNIGASDKQGYRERDNRARLMRNALLRRMQAMQSGRFGSANAMRPQKQTPYSGRSGGM